MSRAPADKTLTVQSGPAAKPVGAVICVLSSVAAPSEFRLTQGSCRVGAGSDADIVIADATVSRLHAELTLRPEGVLVLDLKSRNGTYYLGQRVEKMTLAFGSHFRVGGTEIAIEIDRHELEACPPSDLAAYGELIGVSEPMRRLFALLTRLEASLVTVLIEGESGTGKELVARALHENSTVRSGPFIAVNCGALDRSLVRSELFGHKKGSFTGAIAARTGAFEAADGGTLFLDEVGELPLDVQPVLLRALEHGSIVPMGENIERKVDVRLIAATNRGLKPAVDAGSFRSDLYYRLAVVPLVLAPLRDRPEDIEILARHFAEKLGMSALPATLLKDLRTRPFPGNVRELRNALQAYAALGPNSTPAGGELNQLEAALRRAIEVTKPYAAQKDEFHKLFQRVYFELLLEYTKGNQSEAARVSGLERSYLNRILGKRED